MRSPWPYCKSVADALGARAISRLAKRPSLAPPTCIFARGEKKICQRRIMCLIGFYFQASISLATRIARDSCFYSAVLHTFSRDININKHYKQRTYRYFMGIGVSIEISRLSAFEHIAISISGNDLKSFWKRKASHRKLNTNSEFLVLNIKYLKFRFETCTLRDRNLLYKDTILTVMISYDK